MATTRSSTAPLLRALQPERAAPRGGLSLAVPQPPRNYPGSCSQREPKRPKATYALDLRGLPGLHGLERPHEHLVEPERVGAVLPPDVVGIHDVAPQLRHPLVVLAQDCPPA